MNPSLYVWLEEQEQGPFALVDLRLQVESGEFSENALVRDLNGGDWGPLNRWIREAQMAEDFAKEAASNAVKRSKVDDPWEASPAGGFVVFGVFIGFFGVLLAYVTFTIETAPGGVHNIGLLNERLCICIGSATLLLIGSLLVCTGFLASRLGQVRTSVPPAVHGD